MAKANGKAKANVTMETKTTKTNNRKETKTMKNGNEFEMIMAALNGINSKVDVLETEIAKIKASDVKETSKAIKTTKKSSAKGTAKKTTNKANGTGKGKKSTRKSAPTTYAEAIAKWEEEKGITEESKKAYGQAAREIREEMMAENKKMVKTVKGKKVYDDNYYVGKKWTREFNRRMKERGFTVR